MQIRNTQEFLTMTRLLFIAAMLLPLICVVDVNTNADELAKGHTFFNNSDLFTHSHSTSWDNLYIAERGTDVEIHAWYIFDLVGQPRLNVTIQARRNDVAIKSVDYEVFFLPEGRAIPVKIKDTVDIAGGLLKDAGERVFQGLYWLKKDGAILRNLGTNTYFSLTHILSVNGKKIDDSWTEEFAKKIIDSEVGKIHREIADRDAERKKKGRKNEPRNK